MPNQTENPRHHLFWRLCSFNELSNNQLYDIMKLRQEVFVVEQNCPYLDTDDYDQGSLHLIGLLKNDLVAYARILPPDVYYREPSVGRIASKPSLRGKGIGKQTVAKCIEIMESRFGKQAIRIMAQCYLIKFYEDFGFEIKGEEFLEDGIPHIEMVRI